LGYEIHSRQLFQFRRSDETIANTLNFTIGNPVPPLEPFDGLVAAPGQKVHSPFRGIVDKRPVASRSVQEGNIEAHDAKPDYADFAYFLNHKTKFSRKNSTAPEIPQHSAKLNVISGVASLPCLDLT